MKKLIIFILLNFLIINVWAIEDATLKNIKINGKECTCVEYICQMEVSESNVNITYELSDPNATADRVSGVSTPITSDVTNIKINVTNGESHVTYEFIINKHIKSSDYTLKELYLNEEEITLTEEVYVYNTSVKFDEENIIIEAIPNDTKASVDKELAFLFPVSESSKSFDFKVTAEDGTEKNYRIFVTRKEKPDTTLKSLKVDVGEINFYKDVLEYNLEVDYAVNDLIVEAIPNNDKANVKITKDTLQVGDNTISIDVTNEEVTTTYLIHVKRNPNLDTSQANLEKLVIKEYKNLDFDPNVLDYELGFKEIPSSLTITATPVLEGAVVDITNNSDLEDGTIVSIKVTLQSDEYEDIEITRIYNLKIVKLQEDINENKLPIIIAIIVLVIVIIVLIILNFRDNKKNKNKKKMVKKEVKKDIKNENKVLEKKTTSKKVEKVEEIEEIEIL